MAPHSWPGKARPLPGPPPARQAARRDSPVRAAKAPAPQRRLPAQTTQRAEWRGAAVASWSASVSSRRNTIIVQWPVDSFALPGAGSNPMTALTVVIFGASGDLTSRKLIPSLYRLARKERLPPEPHIRGVAGSPGPERQVPARLAGAVAWLGQ